MNRNELIKILLENTMESSEVVEYLGISKQLLSDMNRQGKLRAIKKGLYLRMDVENEKLNKMSYVINISQTPRRELTNRQFPSLLTRIFVSSEWSLKK